MQKFYGNYLGLCINNADPEFRGRVQIFIPHILPALYERWNKEGKNIKIEIIGNNLENALSQEDIEILKKVLPWSEGAAPVFGNSAAGHYNPASGNFNQTSGTENENTSYSEVGNNSIGDFIFNREARRDANSNLAVYNLPSGDGGGSYEVAGINERYHPEEAAALRSLIQQGRYEEAESRAKNYIISYTNNAVSLAANSGSELSLRDMAFNRGLGGANWIAKYAAGLTPNTSMNDSARQQIINAQQNDPQGFLQRLREGAERYELDVVGLRPQFIDGLRNRWNARLNNSLNLLNSSPSKLSLNEPFRGILPGSANPAQHLPQLESANPTYLNEVPNQQAVLDSAAATLASAGITPPGTSSGSRNAFDFDKATKNFTLKTSRMTYCARGTALVAGWVTGNSAWRTGRSGFNGNDFNAANGVLTAPATSGPGRGQVLYSNEGRIQGTSYAPQQGDIVMHSRGIRGGRFGHAHIFLNGQWHSYKTEGRTQPALQGYFNVSGQRSNLFRLTPEGRQAMLATGLADTTQLGVPYEGEAPIITGSIDGDENNNNEFDGSLVSNPTSTQPTVTDTTGMPQGLFSVPNPGAMLWVFFREGDPLYPVYFAASYGAREWQNVMKAGSPGAHYPTAGDTTPRNQAIFRPNQSGGISFVDTLTEEENARSIRVFHENGGHMEWHHHGSTLYSPNEHIQQVAGSLYDSCTYRSFWTQGKNEDITIGDRVVIVGNASQEALDYIEQHAQIVKDINKNMLKNGGSSGNTSSLSNSSSTNGSTIASNGTNSVANFFGNFANLISSPISNNTPPTPTQQT